ncbi:MAG: S8 family serine peptidase, partial [Bacteroidales bacterium]|nr:S8 family serine peptidase [Bacteroidales bacterium]
MKQLLIALLISIFSLGLNAQSLSETEIYKDDFLPKTVIFKINPENKNLCKASSIDDENLMMFFSEIKLKSFRKKFPNTEAPKFPENKYGHKTADLTTIYEIVYEADIEVEDVIFNLKKNPIIKYAVPHYLPKLIDSYYPNDPSAGNQYYLSRIKAYEAWGICKGDSAIIIGISDTGIDIDHPDLTGNIAYNLNDPINGLDDDNDGFVDNFRGWDFADNDNNPQTADVDLTIDPSYSAAHGTWVSGCGGAEADNNIGIAGTGFYTRIMPLKIQNHQRQLVNAYESIVYAAEHGCSVINCSWGGYSPTEYAQDVITYATINKNSLVVAGAGNNHINKNMYPASYQYVISVGGTKSTDEKWTDVSGSGVTVGSNYGIYVDLCAPAQNLYSTVNDGGYGYLWGGTSFASPVVSGCAGIVKAYFPELDAIQVGERLRVTSDNIDTIPLNSAYVGLLGKGRVNLYRALTDTLIPSVRIINESLSGNSGPFVESGDTLIINGEMINYLTATAELSVTMTSTSPYIEILSSNLNVGIIESLDIFTIPNNTFKIRVLPTCPYDQSVMLKFNFADTNYTDFQYVEIEVNPTMLDIDTNLIKATITSNGKIAYDYTKVNTGNGFTYNNSESLMYEGGLVAGINSTFVLSSVRGENDFYLLSRAEKQSPGTFANQEINCYFSDLAGGFNTFGLEILQDVYAWNSEGNEDYIMVKYGFVNTTDSIFNNFYSGICVDWDIMDYNKNKTLFDIDRSAAYTYSTESFGLFGGIQLLSSGPVNCYAFDNMAGGNGGIDISDGFSNTEKYSALSTSRYSAGGTGSGNDVVNILSSGPHSILPGDTLNVVFALLAGTELSAITDAATAAMQMYDSLFIGVNEISLHNNNLSIYPNPGNDVFNFVFDS